MKCLPVSATFSSDNITIDNHEFAETKERTDSNFGLLAKTLAVSTKVSNVTFTNVDINLITTRLYGIKYFGLIASNHGGLIENITLTNTNFNITHERPAARHEGVDREGRHGLPAPAPVRAR